MTLIHKTVWSAINMSSRGGIGVEFRKLFLADFFIRAARCTWLSKEQVHAAVGGTSAGFLTHQKAQFGIVQDAQSWQNKVVFRESLVRLKVFFVLVGGVDPSYSFKDS